MAVTTVDLGSVIGPQGPQGETGPQGPKGDTGATGPQGPKGDTGATGSKGATGAAAGFGTPTCSTTTGNAGTSASVSVSASGANTAKVFNFKFTIPRGATGAQGPKGDTGATGPQGPKGDTGATGPQGPKGDTGATGPQGDPGIKQASGSPNEELGAYIIFNDNTMICYRTLTTEATFTQQNGLYISDWIDLDQMYALSFDKDSVPNVLVNINIPWSDSHCAWASGVRSGTYLKPGKIKIISTTDAGGLITITWVAVGRRSI